MGGWVAFLTPQHHRAIRNDPVMAERMSSVGKPASYAEIRLRGVGDDQPVPAGELGEITVRSSSNFSGYLNRPDETADTLRGEWVYTGDVGYFDAEGFLFAVDRVKDLVITGGMNVASAEVEAVLAEHAAIESVAVIGLPSDEWGEAVTGVVVLRPDQSVSAQDLIAFARTRLAGYKVPKSIRFVTALPLNGVGKVLKRVLREQFQTR
jgi:acyl-CoA synthetase (AMP-forming)/AMP-acid ligase II